MKAVDLHPEDLIERESRGELTADERERLQLHLAQCDVCRFERLARDDFRAELDQAEDVDVKRLLAAALTPESLRIPSPPAASHPRRLRWSRAALIAAALVTLAGVSTASGWSVLRATFTHRERADDTLVEAAPTGAARSGSRGTATPPPTAVAVGEPDRFAPTVSAEPSAPPVPSPSSTSPSPARAPMPETAARAGGLPEPGALFADATRARRAGDRDLAIRIYRSLIAGYPGSAEGRHGLAVLGQMLLDGGDAAGALRCFDDYLRTGGPLREDVMADRAISLQRLGRPSDEAGAWSEVLASYPGSVHTERARRRLSELGAR
jgi:TolA-binding protein